jgi:hypothetical protein
VYPGEHEVYNEEGLCVRVSMKCRMRRVCVSG